ncbi:MAG: M14 family metallopeptidase [Candidatus Bathyarchaeota archaeon]|nr:M14 family metallopeptidase [Candidatus Bathyarchaeota archaeon]
MSKINTPEEFLGFKPGTERKVADWPQIVEYYRKIADASNRVKVDVLGETTEGNPFIRAIVTSEGNMTGLEEIRENQMRICNPVGVTPEEEGRLVSGGKTVVLITCSIHSTEIAASQMSLDLLHKLATGDTEEVMEILENVVLLIVPSLNPDGHEIVVDWYRESLDTEYEGTNPPWMYHKYVGHDNNRDWFMFTQKETRLAVGEIHNRWHPQIVYDLHQMGSWGARLFVPPFTDPIDPNIDPVLQSQIAFLGTSMLNELVTEGKRGVWCSAGYDLWTPARHYQCYHGGVRILSEAASVRIASPIEVKREEIQSRRGMSPLVQRWNNPLPWTGGSWTLGDIVDYEFSAAMALLRNAARYKDRWLKGSLELYKRALDPRGGPYAWVFPPDQKDPDTAAHLLNTLIFGAVEVKVAKEPFEAEGVRYPSGSHVVLYAQPYGRFAKTMLEIQEYPDLREDESQPPKRPYDVTAHTFPLIMHVEAHQIDEEFEAELEAVEEVTIPGGTITGEGKPFYAFTPEWNASFKAANRLLKAGAEVFRACWPLVAGGERLPPGAFLVKGSSEVAASMKEISGDLGLCFHGLDEMPEDAFTMRAPRVGVYRAWSSMADEGWTRFVLENFGFGFEALTPQDVRQGGLSERFDVLVFADYPRELIVDGASSLMRRYGAEVKYPSRYLAGLGKQGIGEVLKFLRDGGTVIAVNEACDFAIKDLSAPAVNALEEKPPADFYIPGSILRALFDTAHPVGYGLSREEAVFFLRGPAFDVKEGEMVAVYPEANSLLSGWILGEKHLLGRTAVADVPMGNGRAILIGVPPIFRSQTHGTFKVLFNSLLYAASEIY